MKILTAATVIGLLMGTLLCVAGCGNNGRSGTQYKYEGSSFTDTYNLYDDGTYERIYEGLAYVASTTLETGTYTKSPSSILFNVKRVFEGTWANEVPKYSFAYHGTLSDKTLVIEGRIYKKHGSVYSSS